MNDRNSNLVPRVYLLDNDRAAISVVTRVLCSAGFDVVDFKTSEEFIATYRPTAPACLILDLRVSDRGRDVQHWLAQQNDSLPVIGISGHTDIAATVRAMKAGAVDCLTKPINADQLLAAVSDALQRQWAKIAERAQITVIERRMATLTPREREVLMHVVAGQLNKQIAGDLGTVEKTIKVHRARVMRKMQAHSLADLVRMMARIDRNTEIASTRPQPSTLITGFAY